MLSQLHREHDLGEVRRIAEIPECGDMTYDEVTQPRV
jgi:hypothetical protein